MLEDKNELMERKYPEVHYSEWAWVGQYADIHFDNNCDIGTLKKRVDKLVDSVYNNRVEG
jgi:hypothetical protein